MNGYNELRQEIKTVRECISRLGAANPRISESPHLTIVLREAPEGARGLTAAHYGAIATLDEAGEPGIS